MPKKQEVNCLDTKDRIERFSNCRFCGVHGVVETEQGRSLEQIQIVIWEEAGGFLALDTTNAPDSYRIEFANEPAPGKLWVQLYQNDIPVSWALPLEIQKDCHSGFQVYQTDWQTVPMEGTN